MADTPKDLDGASLRRPALRPFSGRPSPGGQGALRPLGSRRPAAAPFVNAPVSPGPTERQRLTPPAVAAYISSEPAAASEQETSLPLAETTDVSTAVAPSFETASAPSSPATSGEGLDVAEPAVAVVADSVFGDFGHSPEAEDAEPSSSGNADVVGAIELRPLGAARVESQAAEPTPSRYDAVEVAAVAANSAAVTDVDTITAEVAPIEPQTEPVEPIGQLANDDAPITQPSPQHAPVAPRAEEDERILPGAEENSQVVLAGKDDQVTVLAAEAAEDGSSMASSDPGRASTDVIGGTDNAPDTSFAPPIRAAVSMLLDTDDLWPHDLAADVETGASVSQTLSAPHDDRVFSIGEPGQAAQSAEASAQVVPEAAEAAEAAEAGVDTMAQESDAWASGVAANADRSAHLLDDELSEFRLTPGERLHEPTPIPGLEEISQSGEEPAQEADDPRGANPVLPALADADDTLRAFTERAAVHDHVIDTLEAVARRVRSGEIVPMTSASATPEAVLASVLASLLALRP